jgi:hypothetical protein
MRADLCIWSRIDATIHGPRRQGLLRSSQSGKTWIHTESLGRHLALGNKPTVSRFDTGYECGRTAQPKRSDESPDTWTALQFFGLAI